MSDKKLSGLSQASNKKKQEALLKTEQAIAKLSQNNNKITVRSVAKEAGVSVSYIYKYPELSYKIQQLREQQKYSLVKGERSIADSEQIKKLQQEKAKLARQIKELKTIIDSKLTGKSSLENLQKENTRLILENQQLKRELKYVRKNLTEAREFILRGDYKEQKESEVFLESEIVRQISDETL
ncbi:MAG: DUF6262 family protein [Cyanobacteria bacterium P01_A01_bin.83]